MLKQILLITLSISVAFAAIAADKISSDTKDFQDVTNAYKGTWYSGYLKIDDKTSAHYWFFPYVDLLGSGDDDKPLLLTVSQGPGCSSMTLQSIYGMGPFVMAEDDSGFVKNERSWNFNANLLFIDPPGVGYSTGGPTGGYTDTYFVNFYNQALQIFLKNYKEVAESPLYLHGVGHAGTIIPKLAEFIYYENMMGTSQADNLRLRGIILGNPVTTVSDIPEKNQKFPFHRYEYLRQQGFIPQELFDQFTPLCGYDPNSFDNSDNEKCQKIIKKINNIYEGLNLQDIGADCYYTQREDLSPAYTCYDHTAAEEFFNNAKNKEKLHVKDLGSNIKYEACKLLDYSYSTDAYQSYKELLQTGMRIWIYAGDQDAEIPHSGVMHWIEQLRDEMQLSDLITYNSWFYQDILEAEYNDIEAFVQNGGSYWKFDGMSYLRFKGCGQDATRCNPIGAELMIKNYLDGIDMSQNYLDV